MTRPLILISAPHTGTRTVQHLLLKHPQVCPKICDFTVVQQLFPCELHRNKKYPGNSYPDDGWAKILSLYKNDDIDNYSYLCYYTFIENQWGKYLSILNPYDAKFVVPIRHPFRVLAAFRQRLEFVPVHKMLELGLLLHVLPHKMIVPVDQYEYMLPDERVKRFATDIEPYLEIKLTKEMAEYIYNWFPVGRKDGTKKYKLTQNDINIINREISNSRVLEYLKVAGVDYTNETFEYPYPPERELP